MARASLDAGEVQAAERFARLVLAANPDDADARVILASLALEAGYVEDTLRLTEEAAAAGHASIELHDLRARAFLQRGDLLDAEREFGVAAETGVPSCDLLASLARTQRDLGRMDRACATALLALREYPDDQRSQSLLFDIMQGAFRAGVRYAAPPVVSASSDPTEPMSRCKISVIICSIHPAKLARVSANYAALLGGVAHEIISINDARSLCEGYNRGIAQAMGDVLVFSHDDIEILTPDFAERLLAHLTRYDLVGVVGTTRVVDATWGMAGWPHCHGQVVHRDPTLAACSVSLFRVAAGTVEDIQGLDGLFFAARRRVIDALRFDAATFDGFHLYDLDFSYSAFMAGFKLAVCNDIVIAHDSRGKFDEAYEKYALRFVAKHRNTLTLQRGSFESLPEAWFDSTAEAREFCASWLACVAGGGPIDPPTVGDGPAGLPWLLPRRSFVSDRVARYPWNQALAGFAAATPSSVFAIGLDESGLARALRDRFAGIPILTGRLGPGCESSAPGPASAEAQLDLDAARSDLRDRECRGFDLICLEGILEHLLDPWTALLALRNVSAAGAQLVVGMTNAYHIAALAAVGESGDGASANTACGPLRPMTLRGLRIGLAQTGWRVIRAGAVLDPRLKEVYAAKQKREGRFIVQYGRFTVDGLTPGALHELCSGYFLVSAVATP